MTIRPPKSLNLSCLATSLDASMLVAKAVDSISFPFVERAELTSIETIASVGSMTIDPPEGNDISL